MAAATTVRNGDWENTTGGVTPWAALTGSGTGGVPGDGDTATLSHNVTANGSQTIGTSPSTNATVLTVNNGKTLTVASGTLTAKGAIDDLNSSGNGLVFAAGTGLTFDATGAASTINYSYTMGNSYDGGQTTNATPRGWRFNGTSGSRITVRSLGDGTRNAYHSNGGSSGGNGCWQGSYVDFIQMGDSNSARPLWKPALDNRTLTHSLSNCTFANCGEIYASGSGTAMTFSLTDCAWSGTVSTWPFRPSATAALTTGSRSITRCSFDKRVGGSGGGQWVGYVIDQCYFGEGLEASTTDAQGGWSYMRKCFWRRTIGRTGGEPYTISGDFTDNFVYDDHTNLNPLCVAPSGTSSPGCTIQGTVWEYRGSDGAGDMFQPPAPSVARTYRLYYNIVLPSQGAPTQEVAGYVMGAGGNANVTLHCDHNTGAAGSQPSFAFGETYAGHANMVASFKSNIGWGVRTAVDGTAQYLLHNFGAATNVVAASACDYNLAWRLKAGSAGKGYNTGFASGSPGANDIAFDTNPGFRDSTRNLAAWDASLGGAGTSAGAVARIAADPTLAYEALLWVRAGFDVSNPLLNNAGHDGLTIGAGAFFSVGTVPYGHVDSLSGGLQTMGF